MHSNKEPSNGSKSLHAVCFFYLSLLYAPPLVYDECQCDLQLPPNVACVVAD